MKQLTRFAEYCVSGGLFWLNMIVFYTLAIIPAGEKNILISALSIWNDWIIVIAATFTNMGSSLESILFAAGLLSIFFTGLILDMISPRFFVSLETYLFKKRFLEPNRQWLEPLMRNNDLFLQQCFEQYVHSNWFECCLKNKKNYSRIKVFIQSYLFTYASSSHLESVNDKMQIWRTSRALAMSMLVLAALLGLSYGIIVNPDTLSTARLGVTVIGFPLLLLAVSIAVNVSMFQRLWMLIAALTYTTISKTQPEILKKDLIEGRSRQELLETAEKLKTEQIKKFAS